MDKEVLGNLEIDQNIVGEVKEELEGWKKDLLSKKEELSENDKNLSSVITTTLINLEKGDYQKTVDGLKELININFYKLGLPALPENQDQSKTKEQIVKEWENNRNNYGQQIYRMIDQIKSLGGIFPNEANMINFLKRANMCREPRLASQTEIDKAEKISRG